VSDFPQPKMNSRDHSFMKSYLLSLGEDFLTFGERVRRSLGCASQGAGASESLARSKGTGSSGEQSSDSSGKLHGGYVFVKTVEKIGNETTTCRSCGRDAKLKSLRRTSYHRISIASTCFSGQRNSTVRDYFSVYLTRSVCTYAKYLASDDL
jgi:hypothetical protein